MENTKVLVVEDEGIVAMDLASRLRRMGYSVPAVAKSGEEAIQKAARIGPDVILMDIRLKGDMDGIEAAAEIQALLSVPIIYLTALADSETMERAQATKPCSYITKPFEESQLQSAIEAALKYASQRDDQVIGRGHRTLDRS